MLLDKLHAVFMPQIPSLLWSSFSFLLISSLPPTSPPVNNWSTSFSRKSLLTLPSHIKYSISLPLCSRVLIFRGAHYCSVIACLHVYVSNHPATHTERSLWWALSLTTVPLLDVHHGAWIINLNEWINEWINQQMNGCIYEQLSSSHRIV